MINLYSSDGRRIIIKPLITKEAIHEEEMMKSNFVKLSWVESVRRVIPAGSYTPAADENLYPVYTKTESGSGFSSYTKVTSAQSDWSGKYLISDGTLTATGSKFSSTALEVTTLTPGTTEYTSYEFTITKSSNVY